MALAEAQLAYRYEPAYWALVKDTMLKVFKANEHDADAAMARLIEAEAASSPAERLLGFHAEPLSIAALALQKEDVGDAELGHYLQLAKQSGWQGEAVADARPGRFRRLRAPLRMAGSRTVLISADECQHFKRRDRQVLTLSDFTEADIAALEATRAPESLKAFDPELHQ